MNQQKAFLVGTHRNSFRFGEYSEIIGVVFITPEGHKPRACYHVRFNDGVEDFTPISDSGNYEIVSESDVKNGIPD